MKKLPTCATCAFWHVPPDPDGHETRENARKAQCRRHAPQAIGHPVDKSWSAYPFADWVATEREEWCGDHSDFWQYDLALE